MTSQTNQPKTLEATFNQAQKHFKAGGSIEIRDYSKGKSVTICRADIAKMFNVSEKEVLFSNVIKYGYPGWKHVFILK